MLVHTARDRRTRVFDFFVAVPSGPRVEPQPVTVIFEGSQTQLFRIGPETCAVPGTAAGCACSPMSISSRVASQGRL
jgi:hypothetical protein